MKMIVVGCGRLGAELAYGLFKRGHDVVAIDQRESEFANLPPDFRGRTLEGDVLTRDMLGRAGLKKADGIASVTNSDAVNALVGHLARVRYKVPNVVIRNYNPRWLALVQSFGIQVISSSSWGAQRIEEMLDGSAHTVFSAGNGEVEVYEFIVPAAWGGRQAADLLARGGDQCLPVALTRAGVAKLLTADRDIETGDVLHLAATRDGAEQLQALLAPPILAPPNLAPPKEV
jgi:trk system potassium uptake protein TrkA